MFGVVVAWFECFGGGGEGGLFGVVVQREEAGSGLGGEYGDGGEGMGEGA